mmetsp:Transcript_5685/g.8375  ORF Transcript_5685/g.8375 Transcript_5685/m.8375 type:complete len:211 (-) Transcript_5685:273-905(-)
MAVGETRESRRRTETAVLVLESNPGLMAAFAPQIHRYRCFVLLVSVVAIWDMINRRTNDCMKESNFQPSIAMLYVNTLRLRGGDAFEKYRKWDNIQFSDEEHEQSTIKDVEAARTDLVEPPDEYLDIVQGNWTTEFRGIQENPIVTGREVVWNSMDGDNRSGLYFDLQMNTLYLNGWLLQRGNCNRTHLMWSIKDTKTGINDAIYWKRNE